MILLASQSPRRRELLTLLGLPFEVAVANVAEVPQAGEPPDSLVVRLSQAKAHAVDARPDALVIACDTVVALEGDLLGKPRDPAAAVAMLRRLRGRSHAVYSAVTLLEMASGRTLTDVVETQVMMRPYTETEIAAYVASGDPLDKAGAYAIQHAAFHPVAELRGCYANVMGLPLCHLTRLLRAWETESSCDVPAACQAHTGHHCPVYATILNDL
ncbi:MAG: septum formation protein Maf [Chloroflexi bacterium]|nr:MAG: septum formation protein Maf [Anaerolineaceae bacterium 4572_32.1]RLC99580.1 MAG: septum formation protein Maf [Chloroflexota bacterium]